MYSGYSEVSEVSWQAMLFNVLCLCNIILTVPHLFYLLSKKHYFIFFLALTIFLVLSCISLTNVFIFLSTVPIKLKLLISKKQISFTFPFLASSIRPSIYEECTNCWKQERFASIVREKQRGEGLLENSVAINIHDDKTMLKPIIVNLSLITFWGPVTNLEN